MKIVFVSALLSLCAGAAGADTCAAIKFAPGASGAVIEGTAYSESMTCFTLEVGAGQTATVRIVESGGGDTAFNIADVTRGSYVVDNQIAYDFQTSAGVYRIDVYRTFAREAPVPFRMSVSVR